ncbi:alpha-L-fucosidase [Rubellicoccus peritrichatus]|uniref:alpha-L-fucosidase n=1 Tax=Rubellicoccus peritrichatus TaxID=3080537 RepID=A0AAQ3LGP9_9BACT|nr:alpha-L-fucosidase [Puniceicoccus sp. CR14]WOO43570.1 alpha-L-fucosidase [Puniceicoccus sp. CR14]
MFCFINTLKKYSTVAPLVSGILLPFYSNAETELTEPKFEPTLESLEQYECPEWFRDAKFGIWSCWNAYTVPGNGDWYARGMYEQGTSHYNYHVKNYGHPSEFGYKDILHLWRGEKFNPKEQIELFKQAGAKYFVVMANHHDNFDLWDSKHQKWNSVNYGPKIDIVAEWQKVTLEAGLRFGITSHLERTWSWFQTNKGFDKTGPYAGVPYDGNDPAYEDLYLKPDPNGDTNRAHPVNAPVEWREHWLDRCKDVIEKYDPDMFYVDGGVPFYGDDKGQTGLRMIAFLYNHSMKMNDGQNEAVMCIKNWKNEGKWGYYWPGIATLDLERHRLDYIDPEPWQTDTSIGDWTWNRNTTYRSAENIIVELVDIVSKNGNLLLNVSPRDDGSLDDAAVALLEEIGDWMAINSESIYDTRYWKVWGADQLRVVQKDGDLYVTTFVWPEERTMTIPFLITENSSAKFSKIELLGHEGEIDFQSTAEGLVIDFPAERPCDHAWVFKISGENFDTIDLEAFKKSYESSPQKIKIWAEVSKKVELPADYKAITFAKNGQLWAINADNHVVSRDGSEFTVLDQQGVDIGGNQQGIIVVAGLDGLVHLLKDEKWQTLEGLTDVTRVDIAESGKVWAVYNESKIAFNKDGKWKTISGGGTDVACGPGNMIAAPGSGGVLYFYQGEKWSKQGGSGAIRLDVSPKTGHTVVANKVNNIYAYHRGKWMKLPGKATDVACGKVNDDEIIGWIAE